MVIVHTTRESRVTRAGAEDDERQRAAKDGGEQLVHDLKNFNFYLVFILFLYYMSPVRVPCADVIRGDGTRLNCRERRPSPTCFASQTKRENGEEKKRVKRSSSSSSGIQNNIFLFRFDPFPGDCFAYNTQRRLNNQKRCQAIFRFNRQRKGKIQKKNG